MSLNPIYLVTFLFLNIVVSKCIVTNAAGFGPAPVCARKECPVYTVVHTQKEFEIRSYKDAQWLSTTGTPSTSYNIDVARKDFLTLLGYFYGENSKNENINMTSPILVGFENSKYIVYFYLPEKYQEINSEPQPLKKEIKRVQLPLHKYAAVRRFDGTIDNTTTSMNLDALKKSLESSPNYQRATKSDVFMIASYNSLDPIDLVNEIIVWFD